MLNDSLLNSDKEIGVIQGITGKVLIKKEGESTFRELKEGETVSRDDLIDTRFGQISSLKTTSGELLTSDRDFQAIDQIIKKEDSGQESLNLPEESTSTQGTYEQQKQSESGTPTELTEPSSDEGEELVEIFIPKEQRAQEEQEEQDEDVVDTRENFIKESEAAVSTFNKVAKDIVIDATNNQILL